ncbi:MAG: MMPL family transporter, partial [Actinomycetota bacterium]|nr:MMPL family transporter [Actinomycetota bacterium]
MSRLGRLVLLRRRLVLLATVLFLAVAGILGGGVAAELSGGGFEDPQAESTQAARVLEEQFGSGAPNLVLLVTAPGGVEEPAAVASATELVERLAAEPGVTQVASWWTSGRPDGLKSRDGTQAVILARMPGADDAAVLRVEELGPRFAGDYEGLAVQVGGRAQTFVEVGTTVEHDIIRAESVAIPLTMVLLVLVFGSAVAASLPLLIGVLSILGTFLTLHLLVGVTDVSVYSVNLATSLGLGLGIDYALFMVTRHREELARGRSVADAVLTTISTAGRTVLFSALTVLLSLSALLVFPLYFLRSFAYAGIAAVLFAAIGAIIVLPAALGALGHRVDSLDLRKPLRRMLRLPAPRTAGLDDGLWSRIAHLVMRRPWPIATAVVLLLLFAATPFNAVAFGLPDDRVLPRDANVSVVAETLRQEFPGNESLALSVVAPVASAGSAEITSYALQLSRLDGVERVDAATGSFLDGLQVAPAGPASARFVAGGGTFLSVIPSVESYSPAGERLVEDIRTVDSPLGEVLVDGQAAALVDTKAALGQDLPLALGLIMVATFVLLFLFTGSVVIPLKALTLNLLSLCATFGAMVWIFQQGNLTGLLGDPVVTGTLDTTIPILMFCVLFGLSMDYEVFLLSRIREVYLATGDNTRAVAVGLQRTGRIVTAAAALLAIVFLAFLSSDISFIKLLGLGTALAILVDATLIRGALV